MRGVAMAGGCSGIRTPHEICLRACAFYCAVHNVQVGVYISFQVFLSVRYIPDGSLHEDVLEVVELTDLSDQTLAVGVRARGSLNKRGVKIAYFCVHGYDCAVDV